MCFCLQEWFCLAMDLRFYALKIKNANLTTLGSFFQQDGMNCMKRDLHNCFTYEMLAHTKKVCQLFKSGAPEAL